MAHRRSRLQDLFALKQFCTFPLAMDLSSNIAIEKLLRVSYFLSVDQLTAIFNIYVTGISTGL